MEDDLVLDVLSRNKIDYFSYSLFYKGVPVMAHCNNKYWMEYYRDYVIENKVMPPVQKYILCSNTRVLEWDSSSLDIDTIKYVKNRNDVAEVSSNITLLGRKKDYIAAITFGAKAKDSYLYDFLNNNPEFLSNVNRELFFFSSAG